MLRLILLLVCLRDSGLTADTENTSCLDIPCSCCESGKCTDGTENVCDACKVGYTGLKCIEPCPANCVDCSQLFLDSKKDKVCEHCKNGFYNGHYQDLPNQPLQQDCTLSCRNFCNKCTSFYNCIECKNGMYLAEDKSCKPCPVNCQQCTSSSDCDLCEHRHYWTGSYCMLCEPNCEYCNSNSECNKCATGFYLSDGRCISCDPGCKSCDKNAVCAECQEGYFLKDNRCSPCHESCVSCSNTNRCFTCKQRFHGINCLNICSDGCVNLTCNESDGICSYGCFKGYWGSRCDHNCSVNCKDSECDRNNGTCAKGCIAEYSGNRCDCPTNCMCDKQGNCLSCIRGFGKTCEKPCGKGCHEAKCNRTTGKCLFTSAPASKAEDGSSTMLVVSSVLGTVGVVLLVALIIVCYRKRNVILESIAENQTVRLQMTGGSDASSSIKTTTDDNYVTNGSDHLSKPTNFVEQEERKALMPSNNVIDGSKATTRSSHLSTSTCTNVGNSALTPSDRATDGNHAMLSNTSLSTSTNSSKESFKDAPEWIGSLTAIDERNTNQVQSSSGKEQDRVQEEEHMPLQSEQSYMRKKTRIQRRETFAGTPSKKIIEQI